MATISIHSIGARVAFWLLLLRFLVGVLYNKLRLWLAWPLGSARPVNTRSTLATRPPGSINATRTYDTSVQYDDSEMGRNMLDAYLPSVETTGMKSPYKETQLASHSMKHKSRSEKFHKVFKDLPQDEIVLKSYSCAYFGDILLQGYLYLTSNYFCFYSRILVHEKQIIIPVSSVLKITREKTAFIIPNAVGILSNEDKYVFGSLMSRDNTFKKLEAIWKQYHGETEGNLSGTDNNNTIHHRLSGEMTPNTTFDDSEEDASECSICIQCGKELDHDDDEHYCTTPTPSPGSPHEHSLPSPGATLGAPHGLGQGQGQGQGPGKTETAPHRSVSMSTSSNVSASTPTSVASKCSGQEKTKAVTHLVSKVQSMPRATLLLLVCVTMLMFLVLSAAVLGYKVLMLQAQLDGTLGWIDPESSRYFYNQKVYSDMYYLNNRYHTATIHKFHSILEANIQILDEVHASLKSLQESPLLRNSCSVASDADGS